MKELSQIVSIDFERMFWESVVVFRVREFGSNIFPDEEEHLTYLWKATI